MNKILLGALGATSLLACAPAAQAANFVPGTPQFTTTPSPVTPSTTGTISADIGRNGLAAGTFTDHFLFALPRNGTGSGSVSTSTGGFHANTDLDFSSVTINGTIVPITVMGGGLIEFAGISSVPIIRNAVNDLAITYVSRGNGSYGGNLTFIPAVAEPAIWAMMIVGMGMIGAGLRHRRRVTRVAFA